MKKYLLAFIVGCLVAFGLSQLIKPKEKVRVNTVTKIETVVDTIRDTKIEYVDKPVFYTKIVTEKGKDSIVIQRDSVAGSNVANQYNTQLKADNAVADLQVYTTGTLIDVRGTIKYPKETIITTVTKIRDASGMYLYLDAPVTNVEGLGVGLMYQFRNKLILKTGVNYNNFTNRPEINIGIGFKIF